MRTIEESVVQEASPRGEVINALDLTAAPKGLIDGRSEVIGGSMSTMLVEVYDALEEAGASGEKARAAAASLTGRDQGLDEVDRQFQHVGQRLDDVGRGVDSVEQTLQALTTVARSSRRFEP